MASKAEVEKLKRRHGRALLRTGGVSGVGVERGAGEDDYILVVHLENDDANARNVVEKVLGPGQPVRLIRSGRFRKQ